MNFATILGVIDCHWSMAMIKSGGLKILIGGVGVWVVLV